VLKPTIFNFKYQISRPYADSSSANIPNNFVHPKLIRSEELVQLARDLVIKEDWHNVYSLLETALEMQEKYMGDMKGETATTAYFLLGVTYFRLQKFDLSEENFRTAIDLLKPKTDKESLSELSLVYFNFSQLLHVMKKADEAASAMEDSIRLSSGVSDTIYTAQLTNLSIYLASAGKLEEAREKSEKALDLAIKELGKDNKYTRSCFANYYLILSKLEDSNAITKLKEKWESCDKISPSDVKGVSAQEFNNIVEELTYSVKKMQPRFIPHGPVKGPTLYKEELLQFVNLWKDKGYPVDESIYGTLDQEIDAIKQGEKTRARLESALTKQRNEYAQKQLEIIEKQIESDLQTTRDRNKKRDIRIFQEETQFTDKLLETTEVPRFIVDRVKPKDHFKERGSRFDNATTLEEIEAALPPDRDSEDQNLLDLLESGGREGSKGGIGDQDIWIHRPAEMDDEEWRNYVEQERGLEVKKVKVDENGVEKKVEFDFFEHDDSDYDYDYEQDAEYNRENDTKEVEFERKDTTPKPGEDFEDETSLDEPPEIRTQK